MYYRSEFGQNGYWDRWQHTLIYTHTQTEYASMTAKLNYRTDSTTHWRLINLIMDLCRWSVYMCVRMCAFWVCVFMFMYMKLGSMCTFILVRDCYINIHHGTSIGLKRTVDMS